jgi:hypothetical protein
MDLVEAGWEGVNWIMLNLFQNFGNILGCCECGNEPSDCIICGEFGN